METKASFSSLGTPNLGVWESEGEQQQNDAGIAFDPDTDPDSSNYVTMPGTFGDNWYGYRNPESGMMRVVAKGMGKGPYSAGETLTRLPVTPQNRVVPRNPDSPGNEFLFQQSGKIVTPEPDILSYRL